MFSTEIRPPQWFAGRRVTVMGLGLFGGGRGVTEFLCRQGAQVTVTDLRGEEELRSTLRQIADLPVRLVLGRHREEDFLGAELVVPSPAVPRGAPLLAACARAGVPLDTETNLLLKYCRGRVCAVTGSNGKTTTTTLIGRIASREWPRTLLGGNLGRSLLPDVEAIEPEDWVVLELSSFQLEDLAGLDRRPEVSVVTNLTPNHLDRHGSYEAYASAKREILEPGPPGAVAVLNGEDPLVRSWAGVGGRRAIWFGRTSDVTARGPGVWLDEGRNEVFFGDRGRREALFSPDDVPLPGRFNRLNAAAAAAAALAMGARPETIRDAVRSFEGVEHRLETIRERDGVRYVNDSIATTPESTIAALEALGPEVLLICGGAPKGCSFARLGEAAGRGAREVFLLGTTAGDIEAAIRGARHQPRIHRCSDLEKALREASRRARPGDTVLLSPACPSYDQFTNFEERGRRFRDLALAL